MMMIRALIFDLDGTLLDTLQDIAMAMNAALQAHGLPTHPIARFREFVGDGPRVALERAVPACWRNDAPLVDAVTAHYLSVYQRQWQVHTQPFDGIEEAVETALAQGWQIAVLSNKVHPATQRVIQYFFPHYPWRRVQGLCPEVPKKPSPVAALEIAQEMRLQPAEIAFVGDSDADMGCAVAAGMWPLGVSWGFNEENELREHGAREILASPAELTAWIKQRA
jgi:phosphoglycolate phosphatase